MTRRAYLSSLALLVLRTDKLAASFLPSKVKSQLVAELSKFYNDLELGEVRVRRPSKFLFLCGGYISPDANARAQNLRDYLYRVRRLPGRFNIVLAERATQLYRDSHYGDLISFEEDIARIASIVLVIAESAGSLAELGAFTANDTIQRSLRVVIQEHYDLSESFVRYGPIYRIKKAKRSNLAVYPWRSHGNGTLNIRSTIPHFRPIVSFVDNHFKAIPNSTTYERLGEAQLFYIIYWVVHLCLAVSTTTLNDYVRLCAPGTSDQIIRNKLYCMKLAGWIAVHSYNTEDYVWALHDEDPFEYEFKQGVIDRADSRRRKMLVQAALRKAEHLPAYIVREASKPRGARAP
jgi:hypothetical protein